MKKVIKPLFITSIFVISLFFNSCSKGYGCYFTKVNDLNGECEKVKIPNEPLKVFPDEIPDSLKTLCENHSPDPSPFCKP